MAENQRPVSILPENFSHGGGLLDDADVTIKTARWRSWDYQGKSDKPTLACHVTYLTEDGQEQEQYYSAGDPEAFVPSADEKSLRRVGKREALSDSTNFFQFISSVFHAGFPPDKVEGSDVSFLDGLKVHVLQEAQPERKGLNQQPREGGRARTVLCVAKIYNLPKGAKGQAAKGQAATSKANGTTGTADAAGLEDAATEAVLAVLGDNDGSVTKQKLSQLMFKQLAGNAKRNDIIKVAFQEDFLTGSAMFQFDGTTISLPA